jgi:hypothetical protein
MRKSLEDGAMGDELKLAFGRAVGFTLAAVLLLVGGGVVLIFLAAAFFRFLYGG